MRRPESPLPFLSETKGFNDSYDTPPELPGRQHQHRANTAQAQMPILKLLADEKQPSRAGKGTHELDLPTENGKSRIGQTQNRERRHSMTATRGQQEHGKRKARQVLYRYPNAAACLCSLIPTPPMTTVTGNFSFTEKLTHNQHRHLTVKEIKTTPYQSSPLQRTRQGDDGGLHSVKKSANVTFFELTKKSRLFAPGDKSIPGVAGGWRPSICRRSKPSPTAMSLHASARTRHPDNDTTLLLVVFW